MTRQRREAAKFWNSVRTAPARFNPVFAFDGGAGVHEPMTHLQVDGPMVERVLLAVSETQREMGVA